MATDDTLDLKPMRLEDFYDFFSRKLFESGHTLRHSRQGIINHDRKRPSPGFLFSKMTFDGLLDIGDCFIESVPFGMYRITNGLRRISAFWSGLYRKLYYAWHFHIYFLHYIIRNSWKEGFPI